jgi:heme-degrading monooxygenase HmoA
MFIAMNRFKVETGSEEQFEQIWKDRDSTLNEMPGFVSFNLLRGATNEAEGFTLFASHTIWKTKADFESWTKSQNFRDAHRNAGDRRTIYKGHPVFEGFSVVEGA